MSTIVYINSSTAHSNNHDSSYLYGFDRYQQSNNIQNSDQNQNEEETEMRDDSQTMLTNDLHQDECCQVCGDIASGWHYG